jgi:hypothetical protein
MTEKNISTGFEELDSDFAEFRQFISNDGLDALRELAQKRDVKVGDLFRIMPLGAVRFARNLLDDKDFEKSVRSVASDSEPLLKEAREIAKEKIQPLFDSEALYKIVYPDKLPSEKSERRHELQKLNTIDSISALSSWMVFDSEKIYPTIRFFFSSDDTPLLDSVLDWDDAMFLAEAMISETNRDLVKYQSVVGADASILGDAEFLERMKERIKNIESALDELKAQTERKP